MYTTSLKLKLYFYNIYYNNQEEITGDCTVPAGIIDACRIGKEYSELTQELAIDTYPNDEALKMIQKAMQEYEGNKEQEPDVHPLELEQNYLNLGAPSHDSESET